MYEMKVGNPPPGSIPYSFLRAFCFFLYPDISCSLGWSCISSYYRILPSMVENERPIFLPLSSTLINSTTNLKSFSVTSTAFDSCGPLKECDA